MTSGSVTSATERRELLKEVYEQARGCIACQLHQTRTQVVFGAGNADADLMFIGEAPGADEDRLGLPFVGRAGKLLDQLLGEIGLERPDVFIANTLKCRPPSNRDPYPNEIETCSGYLRRQVELIQPKVICTLGNFSTKLLRADPTGISRLHGRDEVRTIGTRAIRLLPLYHPAAALYTPSNLQTLRDDFARIPELLALDPPPQPDPAAEAEPQREVEVEVEVEVEPAPAAAGPGTRPEPEPDRHADLPPDPGDAQLGLF
ncbi:MAG: uracil-DNA glycosylase [Solirubrobacteraceae bacterium]